jgi:hypothetical protein
MTNFEVNHYNSNQRIRMTALKIFIVSAVILMNIFVLYWGFQDVHCRIEIVENVTNTDILHYPIDRIKSISAS